ncbi:MAG: hypothetical protein ACI4UV_01120, partial [Victivallales bacterium]
FRFSAYIFGAGIFTAVSTGLPKSIPKHLHFPQNGIGYPLKNSGPDNARHNRKTQHSFRGLPV